METKRCFKCLCVKPPSDFYAHPMMADGRLNKCKACTRKDVTEHRNANIERIRAYDKARASMPHRVAARKEYAKTPEGRAAHARALKVSSIRFPERDFARHALGNAVRDGRIERWPCEVCGSVSTEGHHPDYSRPLVVVWLCNRHHREAHKVA
jgi:hypothetical protein